MPKLTDVYSIVDFKAPTLSPPTFLPREGFPFGLNLHFLASSQCQNLCMLLLMCVVCVSVWVPAEARKDPQELELQDLVDYLMWVLETNCRSSESAANTLNHLATSAGPFLHIL